MKFESALQAKDYFFKYRQFPEGYSALLYYRDLGKPEGMVFNMGEWALIRHVWRHGKREELSDLMLILVVGHTVWDQAIVLEFVQDWRRWQYKAEVLHESGDFYLSLAEGDRQVEHIQFWTDDVAVLGRWDKRPGFHEILNAVRNENLPRL